MTFQEFLEKYNGRSVDFDGWFGFQCMDLMHQYIHDVLGLTDVKILSAPLARLVFENFDNVAGHEYFEKIENRITAVHIGDNPYAARFEKAFGARKNITIFTVKKKEDIPHIVLGKIGEYFREAL